MQSRKHFTKFAPGDPLRSIPAPLLNTLINHQEQVERLTNRTGQGPIHISHDFSWAWVKNYSGSDRSQWDVLCLQDLEFSQANNPADFARANFCFKGYTPTAAYAGKFAILMEAVPNNRVGKGLLLGTCPAQVNVVSSGDTQADVDNGVATDLKSGGGPAQILWKANPSGTGVMWCVVRLTYQSSGNLNFRRFQLRQDLQQGGSSAQAEQLIYFPNKCHLQPNGVLFHVYDPFGEMYGTANVTCGICYKLDDTPTPVTCYGYGFTDDTWEILRMTCPNFLGCCCSNTPY